MLKSKLKIHNKSSYKKSFDENNFHRYIEFYRKLLLQNDKNNLKEFFSSIKDLLSFSEKIFSSPTIAEVFFYFCLNGASTAWIIQNKLGIPEATVYRAIKRLRSIGIISPALKISKIKNSKGGPRPTVWALEGTSMKEVADTIKLHYKMLSPKFLVAEEVAQTILDEYINRRKIDEITYKEIIMQVKELRIPFRTPDIANLAANYLNDKGIKVWR
jgi:predicted transcriptional regulator